jgi:hypothetical protein
MTRSARHPRLSRGARAVIACTLVALAALIAEPVASAHVDHNLHAYRLVVKALSAKKAEDVKAFNAYAGDVKTQFTEEQATTSSDDVDRDYLKTQEQNAKTNADEVQEFLALPEFIQAGADNFKFQINTYFDKSSHADRTAFKRACQEIYEGAEQATKGYKDLSQCFTILAGVPPVTGATPDYAACQKEGNLARACAQRANESYAKGFSGLKALE